jgi:hypothetical protein
MIDSREVRHCERCGSPFHPVRELQRFCTKLCHDHFYTEEKREALAHWRAMQRHQKFFATLQP